MVYWKAKHGILQAEKACFAMKSDRIKSYSKKLITRNIPA